MTVKQLIEKLKTLPQECSVMCQVVGQETGAWNMNFDVLNVQQSDWMVQLRVSHPTLKKLPMGDDIFKESL